MKRTFLLILCAFAVQLASASWYWPFDREADTNAPPRLHRLMERANEYIELAQDESAKGEGDKALDYYRQALDELARVARENPDRADKPEFAPLRNKEAACRAAIDSIRFEQVNANVRAVTISDTSELRKKYNKKHGIKEPEAVPAPKAEEESEFAAAPTNAPPAAAKAQAKPKLSDAPDPNDPEEIEKRRPKGLEELVAANKVKNAAPPQDWNGRLHYALGLLRAKDYVAADLMLEKMLQERPTDLNALLLRAAAQVGAGARYAARRTLERAMRAHPKSHLPYYNLASLVLDMGEDAAEARQYYELGRAVGGPRNEALERKVGVK